MLAPESDGNLGCPVFTADALNGSKERLISSDIRTKKWRDSSRHVRSRKRVVFHIRKRS